jgi:Tol biopolymer transport system component
MVTGTRPFDGETPASVIGAILKDTPAPLSSRQPLAPAPLDHVVERCLSKDPDGRWQNAGDVARELHWVARLLTDPNGGALSDAARSRHTRPSLGVAVGLALALLAAAVTGALVSRRFFTADPLPTRNNLRFEVMPPPDATWSPSPTALTAQLALSPDGSRLAFVAARRGEPSRLWIRPLDRVESQAVPGTEGASFPFWSPDGRFVAFFAAGKLKKVDVALGTPQTLAEVAAGRGGAWSPSGVIVFGQSTQPLSQVTADGGPVTPATTFDPAQDAVWHYWPRFLPDGRRFLFLQRSVKPEYQGIYVGSLDSPETTRLVGADVRGLFAAGHLLFVKDGLLFAQVLDEQSLRLSGEPVRIADGVGFYAAAFGYAAIDISSNGVLAFGPALRTSSLVQTFDREGKARGPTVAGSFTSPRLARDQRTVAVSAREGAANADIWLIDLVRGIPSRVTSHSETDYFPAWMPDGRQLLFASSRAPSRSGANAIYRTAVSGDGTESPLAPGSPVRGFPNDVSLDGQFVLFHGLTQRGYDLGGVSLVSGEPPIDFLSTPFNEVQGRFSPDGRWVAYASDESGRFEVYVRAWPSAAERVPVSAGGGMEPEWRRDGKELFYLSADRKIMSVPIEIDGKAIVAGTPQALFSVDVAEPVGPYSTRYAVSADGQQFVVTVNAPLPAPQTLTVFSDWTAELKK